MCASSSESLSKLFLVGSDTSNSFSSSTATMGEWKEKGRKGGQRREGGGEKKREEERRREAKDRGGMEKEEEGVRRERREGEGKRQRIEKRERIKRKRKRRKIRKRGDEGNNNSYTWVAMSQVAHVRACLSAATRRLGGRSFLR